MTTPNDTTPIGNDTTNRTTTDQPTTDRTTTDDTSHGTIPGRTPLTEEAGAPIVPAIHTKNTPTSDQPELRLDTSRRPSPPPTSEEQDAPMVPDLRPSRRRYTDGGSQ